MQTLTFNEFGTRELTMDELNFIAGGYYLCVLAADIGWDIGYEIGSTAAKAVQKWR